MFRDVLSAIDGITARPTLALLIFIALFIAMLIWVLRLSREYIDNAKRIPLDEDPPPQTEEPEPSSGEPKSSSGEPKSSSDEPKSSSEKSAAVDSEKSHPQTGRSNQNNISNRSQE